MSKRLWAVVIALLAAVGLLYYGLSLERPDEPPMLGKLEQRSLRRGGEDRHYLLYTPRQLADKPALVLVFHGSMGDAQSARALYAYEFELLAEEQGFLVAYPQGYDAHFNGCRKAGPYAANLQQVDDVGFMRAVVDVLADEYALDRGKVYATGVSNGGQMALRLALEAPDLMAGVAVVATSLPTAGNMDCTASGEPVSFLLMNGTADPMNPYEGGTVALYGLLGDRGMVESSQATAKYWAELAGHDTPPQYRTLHDSASRDQSTVEVAYWNAPGKKSVALYTVVGGGHSAPHPTIRLPRVLGGSNRDVSAAREIWTFFRSADN